MYTKREILALVDELASELQKDIAISTVATAVHPDSVEAEIRVKAGERNGVIRFQASLIGRLKTWEDDLDD